LALGWAQVEVEVEVGVEVEFKVNVVFGVTAEVGRCCPNTSRGRFWARSLHEAHYYFLHTNTHTDL